MLKLGYMEGNKSELVLMYGGCDGGGTYSGRNAVDIVALGLMVVIIVLALERSHRTAKPRPGGPYFARAAMDDADLRRVMAEFRSQERSVEDRTLSSGSSTVLTPTRPDSRSWVASSRPAQRPSSAVGCATTVT